MKPTVFQNGRQLPGGQIAVDVTSPFFLQGQSLFETMLVGRGRDGFPPVVYKLDRHVQRIQQSARRLRWSGLPSGDTLVTWVEQAAHAFFAHNSNESDHGRCRLTAAWTGEADPPDVVVTVVPYSIPDTPLTVKMTNVKVPGTDDFGAVKTGNRLVYEAALREAKSAGAEEALLIDENDCPVEGSRSNLWVIDGRKVVTPPLSSGVLPGVAGSVVADIAPDIGFEVVYAVLNDERVKRAVQRGDVFMTNALWGVRAVVKLIEKVDQGGSVCAAMPSKAYQRIQSAYTAVDKLI